MPQPSTAPSGAPSADTPQLQLVRRYARLLRETGARTAATRRASAAKPVVAGSRGRPTIPPT